MKQPAAADADLNDARAALERFVVENDELLELEERIGRFNIFDALHIVDREVKHSDFLAWMLDPNESHGQGGLFLRAILMDLFKTARENGFGCPVSPIELDGEELRGVEVRREWRKIDLLIRCEQPLFVVAIENKVKSGEHSNQLSRYYQVVADEFGNVPSMHVFLTVEGDEASEGGWVPYSYGDIHRVLLRVRNANATSVGDDVLSFLDHYLRLIRGRLMDDPAITELCQRIYKNHRQALELIYEQVGSGTSRMLSIADYVLREQDSFLIVKRTSKGLRFMPKKWIDMLPPIGREANTDKKLWVRAVFRLKSNSLMFRVSVGPTTDLELRRRVIVTLSDECGFKTFFKNKENIGNRYAALGSETVIKWKEQEELEDGVIELALRKKLDQLIPRLASVPDKLSPLFENYPAL